MNLGEAVRAIRTKLSKSQQSFSNDLNVTVTSVSRWETNRVTPEPATLVTLYYWAYDLQMLDAAMALADESSALFDAVGRKMIFQQGERFGQIASAILEFRHEMKKRGFEPNVPADLWGVLGRGVTLANVGKDDAQQLLAMLSSGEGMPRRATKA